MSRFKSPVNLFIGMLIHLSDEIIGSNKKGSNKVFSHKLHAEQKCSTAQNNQHTNPPQL